MALCLARVVLPMGLETLGLYKATQSHPRLLPLLWVQCATMACGLVVGVCVVTTFFGGIVRKCRESEAGSTRRQALLSWLQGSTSALRVVKILAVFKPSVLRLIQCRLFGWAPFSGPVSAFYSGWRWMWIGDGVETVIIDVTQLVIVALRHEWTGSSLPTMTLLSASVNVLSIVQSVGQVVSALVCEPFGRKFESTSRPSPSPPPGHPVGDSVIMLRERLLPESEDQVSIPWDRVTREEQIANGASGAVFRGRYHNCAVALKQIFVGKDASERERLLHEVCVWVCVFGGRGLCVVLWLCAPCPVAVSDGSAVVSVRCPGLLLEPSPLSWQ